MTKVITFTISAFIKVTAHIAIITPVPVIATLLTIIITITITTIVNTIIVIIEVSFFA